MIIVASVLVGVVVTGYAAETFHRNVDSKPHKPGNEVVDSARRAAAFVDLLKPKSSIARQELFKILETLLVSSNPAFLNPAFASPHDADEMHVPRILRSSRIDRFQTHMQFDGDSSYGEIRPPSEKQIAYAQALAQQVKKPFPEKALKDSEECRDFIDDCLAKIPPTGSQIAFAETIAREVGIELPEVVTRSRKDCSDYISANRHLLPTEIGNKGDTRGSSSGPPTEKQLLFAIKLAQQRNLGLTAEQLSSKSEMSRFIDSCLNSGSEAETSALDAPTGGVSEGVVVREEEEDADIPF